MAKDLAREIGYIYIDSGAMYRAVTLFALEHGLFDGDDIREAALRDCMDQVKISFMLDASTGKPQTYLNGSNVEERIRSMEISSRVSRIAALPFVRERLTLLQQKMGENRGIVMDGRDIGTSVFPMAELKIFVTASAEVRAQRRYDELKAKGETASFEEILQNVQERDYIDTHREVSPLLKAQDAIELDNSHLTIPEQKSWLLEQFKRVVLS